MSQAEAPHQISSVYLRNLTLKRSSRSYSPTALTSEKPQFLTIPPEIRQKIYDLLLVTNGGQYKLLVERSIGSETDIAFNTGSHAALIIPAHVKSESCSIGLYATKQYDMSLQIMFTCKLVHKEAIPTFFSRNIFGLCLSCMKQCNTPFQRSVGSNMVHIRYLNHPVDYSEENLRDEKSPMKLLPLALKGLQELRRVRGFSVTYLKEAGKRAIWEIGKGLVDNHPSLCKVYYRRWPPWNVDYGVETYYYLTLLAEDEAAGTAVRDDFPVYHLVYHEVLTSIMLVETGLSPDR